MSFDSTIPSIQKPSADVQSIWGAAVAQYEKLTGVHLDHLKKPKTFDEIWSELSQTQSSFQNVRSNGGKYDKLRSKVARSLGPISLVGDIVAHATKAVSYHRHYCLTHYYRLVSSLGLSSKRGYLCRCPVFDQRKNSCRKINLRC